MISGVSILILYGLSCKNRMELFKMYSGYLLEISPNFAEKIDGSVIW